MCALDTNTLVYDFRGMGQVDRHLLGTPPAQVLIPAVVLHELEVGIAKSAEPTKRRAQLAEVLRVVRLLPVDRSAAEQSARVRARLEAAGTPIGPTDTLIAGTALAARATLITRNTRQFGRVAGRDLAD